MVSRAILLGALLAFAGAAYPAADTPKKERPTVKPDATGLPLPDNRRDPEDRRDSASAGASAEPETAPGAGTDLGKEADREDEALRKHDDQEKPSSRNLR